MAKFTLKTARSHGKRGHVTQKQRRMSLNRVTSELGALETPEDALRRLDLVTRWGSAGLLSGSVMHAAVQACRVFLDHVHNRRGETITALQDRVKELEAELKEHRNPSFYR